MFVAVIGFGSGPPFVKLALQEFYVMDLMAVRFSLAFILMLIFALIMRADLKIKKIGLSIYEPNDLYEFSQSPSTPSLLKSFNCLLIWLSAYSLQAF